MTVRIDRGKLNFPLSWRVLLFKAMRTLIQDLAYAARSFARSPGFTAVVVVSIALGIAANSTVYSIINSLVFAAIPVKEPNRLYTLNDGRPSPGRTSETSVTRPAARSSRASLHTFR